MNKCNLFFFSNAWWARQPKTRRIHSQSSGVKSQQTDRAFKWELQFLANDNHVSHSGWHKRIYQLLCHLKCPFSWEKKSLFLLACFVIIQISQVKGISGSYSSVSGQMETVESHPVAVISDDAVMNNGARIPPTLTWKQNKAIKVSLNKIHRCTTLYFTGYLLQGSLVQQFGRNQRKKTKPTTCSICSEFSFSAGRKKEAKHCEVKQKH